MARQRTRYVPALDGLRAFAVLGVIAYHMNFTWAAGGLLGVNVFFVLSGFLITGLLITEFRGTGTIDLPQFWLRRVRRLVPAIITVIVVTAVLCTLFNHVLLTKMRPDIIPSLFFFSNWWQIFHDISYFEALGAPSPLQHFWSLAIEEQFYLVWPVALLFLFKANVGERYLRRGILVLALASVIAMAVLYDPAGDPSRVYYGTDTRAFSLLIGAWLAFVWPAGLLSEDLQIDQNLRWILDGVGLVAFIALIVMFVVADGFSPFLYRGGLLLCSLLSAVLIAVIAHPATLLGRSWALPPLVWIGKRSYGMYLWHFPILLLMTDRGSTTAAPLWWNLLELAIIFAVSALSYTFIENPIRHGAIAELLERIRYGETTWQRWIRENIVPLAGALALVLVAVFGVALVPAEAGMQQADELKEASEAQGTQEEKQEKAVADASQVPEGKYNIVLIGDSIAVGVTGDFELRFPKGLIDGAVSRQMTEAQTIYDYYESQDVVGNVVVFALGTNGVITDDMVDTLVADIGPDKKIYFINTRSPEYAAVENVNATLASAANRYDNVELIDWYGLSAGHDEWFHEDGIHPSPEGAEVYCDMIQEAIGFPKVYDKTKDPNYSSSFDDPNAAAAIEQGEYTGLPAEDGTSANGSADASASTYAEGTGTSAATTDTSGATASTATDTATTQQQ